MANLILGVALGIVLGLVMGVSHAARERDHLKDQVRILKASHHALYGSGLYKK